MKRRIALILFLLPVLLLGRTSYAGDQKVPFGIRVYDIGNAPNFKLNDTEGEIFELDNTRGRWVFLHFWASWCGPCREEMPTIQKMSEKIESDKLQIVMINTSEDEDTIFTWNRLRGGSVPYPSISINFLSVLGRVGARLRPGLRQHEILGL